MFRKCAFLTGLLSLALGAQARADVFTQQFTVTRSGVNAGQGALLGQVLISNIGGAAYTNVYQDNGAPGFSVGDRFVAVAAAPIVTSTAAGGGVTTPVFTPNQGVAIIALEGVVGALSGNVATASFEQGRLTVHPSAVQFNSGVPATFGFANAPVAEFRLVAGDNIVQGNANATLAGFTADQVGNIALNLVAAIQSQGRLLFVEGNPANFITVTTADGLPPGTVIAAEGLFTQFAETIQNPNAAAFNINAADLAVLNQIVAAAGFANTNLFATGLGGALVSNFTPVGPGGIPTGDVATTLNADSTAVLFVDQQPGQVPEPTSMLLWGLGAVGVGLYARRRLKK